jgi:hypothetical protein
LAIKVVVKNKGLNGEHVGLHFVDGVAIVEDEAKGRKIAASFGYEIIEDEKKSEPKKEAPKKNSRKKKDEEK